MTIGKDGESQGIPSFPIEMTTIGLSSQYETERFSVLNTPSPGISDGRISNDDSPPLGDAFENPWDISLPPNVGTQSREPSASARMPSWQESLPIRTETTSPWQRGTEYIRRDSECQTNRGNWRILSGPSQQQRMTNYGMLSPVSSPEGFHYDPQIFGHHPPQNAEDVPDFFMHGVDPLPDSLPKET